MRARASAIVLVLALGSAAASSAVVSPDRTPALSHPGEGVGTCPGDCDNDQRVDIDELILGVGVALGRTAPGDCVALDADANGAATIDEIVRAVAAALGGCGSDATPSPTPTLEPSATPSSEASPTSSPTASPTQIGLGTRRFSIDPGTSPLTAVFEGSEASTLPGFTGFLELTAGEPDAKTGLAFVDVTDASEYIAIDVPAEPAALCIRALRDQFPVERAGIVACNGGLPAGFATRQDHRLGVAGECSGGNAAGSSCQGEDECPGGTCFDAAACAKSGGRVEQPDEPHPGVCNGPPSVSLLAGDGGPGAVWIVPGLADGATQGLPVEILMERATPCGDEDVPGVSALLGLTSGRVEVEVSNADNRSDESLAHEIGGEGFACDRWREENGPGTLVFGGPGLDVPAGALPKDVLTFFVLDD